MKKRLIVLLLLVVCSVLLVANNVINIGNVSNIKNVTKAQKLETVTDFKVMPEQIEDYADISFTCNADVHLTIEILDSKGKIVTMIASQYFTQGYYNLPWDRTDFSGNTLQAGEYVIQVKQDKRYVTKRKTLILK